MLRHIDYNHEPISLVHFSNNRAAALTASTRLPALPCDSELESLPSSDGTVRETGRGLWSDTPGLGLFPLLFPLLSLYLQQTDRQTGFPFTLSAMAAVV